MVLSPIITGIYGIILQKKKKKKNPTQPIIFLTCYHKHTHFFIWPLCLHLVHMSEGMFSHLSRVANSADPDQTAP